MTATASARSGRVRGRDLNLRYLAWGDTEPRDAEPLVLLHGIGGDVEGWNRIVEALDPRRPIIALQARGHGDSDWARDADYSTDAHFADLVSALEELEVRRCALLGFSMGGGVAMIAAAARSELVSRCIVVDAYPAPEMTRGSRGIAGAIAGLRPSRWRPRIDPAIAEAFRRDLAAGVTARLDLWPFWEALACPTLLVRGEVSTVLPATLAAEMAARQPNVTLAEVSGAGHGIPFTHPTALADLVEAFLG
ncbi:MAG: alpha/beta hydrolase [Dehalococcoidia bacterium]